MGDIQGRHAAQTGRHLSPASGAAPRHGSAAPRHRAPERPEPRQDTRPGRLEQPERRERTGVRQAAAPVRRDKAAGGRKKWFRVFLLVYIAILVACTGFLQLRLWLYLDRSQAEMDRQAEELAAREAQEKALYQAPQLAFETWRNEQTAEYWTDLWYAHGVSEMETRERVSEYMGELFAPGATQAYKAPGFSSSAPVYLIKSGDTPLARVTLSGQGLDWDVTDVELLVSGDRSVTVTAAGNCRVSFNGKQMDISLRQPAESLMHYEPLNGLLENPVTWFSYTVDGLLAEPEITVEPPAGYGVIDSGDGNYLLTTTQNVSAYTDLSVQFVKAFLNYYMNGSHNTRSNMNGVLKFLNKDTQAYQDIQNTYNSVNWSTYYGGIDYSKTAAGDVIVWAENCFSVDVTYDADATLSGEHVDYANATMRVYFLRTDGEFIISHFETL